MDCQNQFVVEMIAKLFELSPVDRSIHPIAIAHLQGAQAGKSAGMTPLDCPWPIQNYDASLAWFAGYSLGNLANHNVPRAGLRVQASPEDLLPK